MQIFSRGFAGEGESNESGVVENGDFRLIRSLSSEHFTYMATRQLSGVNDLGHISRSLDCFTSNFSKNGVWYGKSYYRQLKGNRTLAFDCCHFWWPWSTFEGYFSLCCHFHVHFSNPWHAFASHGLPAIAELLVTLVLIYIPSLKHSSMRFGIRALQTLIGPVRYALSLHFIPA